MHTRGHLAAVVTIGMAACGGATTSGLAVGKLGGGLDTYAQMAPQGAEMCAVEKGLAAKPTVIGKPVGEDCSDALKRDRLWRGAMRTLSAYAGTLEALASDNGDESAGKLQAARTGVTGSDWVDAPDTEARDAVAKLVEVMKSDPAKDDLKKTIGAAAPHVKTICDGLEGYLSDQATKATKMFSEVETQRGSQTDRRCGALDSRSVCVNESLLDRVSYGHLYAQLALLESHHAAAHDAVSAFCAAHAELESAAADGKLDDEATRAAIVKAVQSSHASAPAPAADDDAK